MSSMTRAPFVFALAAASLSLGCGATSGKEWLAETHSPTWTNQASDDEPLSRSRIQAPVADEAALPRRRLDRVITLGESNIPSDDAPRAAPEEDTPRMQLHVEPPPPALSYRYGFGAGRYSILPPLPVYPRAAVAPPREPAPSTSPPSYGPAFPFKSAPADPWQEKR